MYKGPNLAFFLIRPGEVEQSCPTSLPVVSRCVQRYVHWARPVSCIRFFQLLFFWVLLLSCQHVLDTLCWSYAQEPVVMVCVKCWTPLCVCCIYGHGADACHRSVCFYVYFRNLFMDKPDFQKKNEFADSSKSGVVERAVQGSRRVSRDWTHKNTLGVWPCKLPHDGLPLRLQQLTLSPALMSCLRKQPRRYIYIYIYICIYVDMYICEYIYIYICRYTRP